MTSEVPLYQNMIDDLIHQIEGGTLPASTKLLSEAELGDAYDVSRITVRRALAELVNRGYIVKRHGIGSFVADRPTQPTDVLGLPDLPGIIRKSGATPKIVLTSFELLVDGREPVPRAKLGLSTDDYLYQLEYEVYADHDLVGTIQWYLDFRRFPNLYLSELENQALLLLLRSKYEFYPHFATARTSSLATTAQRRKLIGGTGNSVVHLHVSASEKSQVLMYGEINVMGAIQMYLYD